MCFRTTAFLLLACLGQAAAAEPSHPKEPAPRLRTMADFPGGTIETLQALLAGASLSSSPQAGALASPLHGTLGQRIPGAGDALLPEGFSVVVWVQLPAGQPSALLFGFGDPEGDYFVAATDSDGAPMLGFLSAESGQFNRAARAPANLADGRLHALVAVVNLGSGLTRLYVDGRPEAASTISFWRPRKAGHGFAFHSPEGAGIPGHATPGLLLPRLIARELTEEEIAALRPEDGMPCAPASLAGPGTLLEFWPAQFAFTLRQRP